MRIDDAKLLHDSFLLNYWKGISTIPTPRIVSQLFRALGYTVPASGKVIDP